MLEIKSWCRRRSQSEFIVPRSLLLMSSSFVILIVIVISQVCLFGPPVLALRPLLRSNLSDEEILPHIGKIVQGKKWSHDGLGGAEGIKLNGKSGPMVSIGG